MADVQKVLVDINQHPTSHVTFRNGSKGEIKSVKKMNCAGQPIIDDVMLVKELDANLISISEMCVQGLDVNFTKHEFLIKNK